MKRYKKDNVIKSPPIKIISNGKVIITNKEKDILNAGWSIYEKPELTIQQQINISNENINKKTDYKILNNFEWNGSEFYLTMENQFNFKNLYDLRNNREYPVLIKTKTGFTTLENAEEVEDFYLSGVQFIEKCLKDGWEEKAEAEKNIKNEGNKVIDEV